jgi:hypothetical protein
VFYGMCRLGCVFVCDFDLGGCDICGSTLGCVQGCVGFLCLESL